MSSLLFSRERLAGYDPSLLRGATVLLVGAGALGNNVALALSLAGVGELLVVDPDVFEVSNATRSPFFVAGAAKAAAVASAFVRTSLLPTASASFAGSVIESLGDAPFLQADVVISAVDQQTIRAYISEQASMTGTPLVEGGFDGHRLSVSVFSNSVPSESPCWRCGFDEVEDSGARGLCTLYAKSVEAQGAVPATQTVAQIAGGLVAEAAIAALHGVLPLDGRRLFLNVRSGRSTVVTLPPNPDCPGRHELAEPAVQLETGADEPVADLLDELRACGYQGEVLLPEPVVLTMPCRECGAPVTVNTRRSFLRQAPKCAPDCNSSTHAPPIVVSTLPIDAPAPDVHARTLGLGPSSRFQLSDGQWLAVAHKDDFVHI